MLRTSEGITIASYLKSERQWSRRSRIGRARWHLKAAWARNDRNDVAFYRGVIKANDFDEAEHIWEQPVVN